MHSLTVDAALVRNTNKNAKDGLKSCSWYYKRNSPADRLVALVSCRY